MAKRKSTRTVETLTHGEASRRNIPTAEHEPVMAEDDRSPVEVAYERRNRDLDPQLVWRGKDEQNWSDLVVQAPPLFIQEKVHPKALINDLLRHSKTAEAERLARESGFQTDLFADFNGLPSDDARTEFYQHDANWSNRMILGDSLQVMASLAEREGLRGKVQCIYLDPPYGIKFNSNFQWSTTSRDVKDGNAKHITREPEQVRAFRDTWRDGIHSYLTYLRDRLVVAKDLLTDSGSIFVQIGDENLHRMRSLVEEVFGEENFIVTIPFQKKAYQEALSLAAINDYLIWATKRRSSMKFRPLYLPTPFEGDVGKYSRIESPELRIEKSTGRDSDDLSALLDHGWQLVREDYPVVSQDPPSEPQPFPFQGAIYEAPKGRHWSQKWPDGMERLAISGRLRGTGNRLYAREYWSDSAIVPRNNLWAQLKGPANPQYVVETTSVVVQRCVLMATDPGDLVLDPTCGSGTTAYVAEQWGRRWITIDTSRVALALARARIMGARYPYYLLADSPEGQQKETEVAGRTPPDSPTDGNVRLGFVYERVPHITLKSIATNAEIDVIWERWQETLEPLREELNDALGRTWEEWEIPREPGDPWPEAATSAWSKLGGAETDQAKEVALGSVNRALNRHYTFDNVPDAPP